MEIAVLLLVVAIAVFAVRRVDKGVRNDPGTTHEERELRGSSDESINLVAYFDNPTPAMKAEYVRRHGEWPGYTAKDFAGFEQGAREFRETIVELLNRYERSVEAMEGAKVGACEPAIDPPISDPRSLSDEAIDMLPFLSEPTDELKAEYVRRRGSWPGRLPMPPEMKRKLHILAAKAKLQAERERVAAERNDGPPGFRPQQGSASGGTEGATPKDGPPGFRPAR